MINFRRF